MKKHERVFFNTQDAFFYGFQLILIKHNLCLSNFNVDYNKIDLIYGFHLSSSNSSEAVTKRKCYKNWPVSTWNKLSLKESFKPTNRNVCFETARRPLLNFYKNIFICRQNHFIKSFKETISKVLVPLQG